ncbi:hypothetical protein BG262_02840 [Floricoccus penangensis]|uniref:Uncharacterized protein n=1 Tax=Floricoccus penangensis TaxID=1859475 RepID=A0A9Q5JG77_9LACT|nr:hypothetical protein [Floricoccus penangensis]OFI46751.1 hypothetical protein BG262_02840 [Floricoccus penangensis]
MVSNFKNAEAYAIQIDSFVQQVRECCRCFECASDEQWRQAIISALQNWGDLTCGNWIDNHDINLQIELSKQCGGCCPNIFRVNLPEEFVQVDTIRVKVRAWEGIKVREIDVESIYDEYTHTLSIDLTNAMNCCNCCETYDLIVDYTVGTDEIPPELCRWFCAIAKLYMELEEVECASCGSMESLKIIEVDGMKDLSASIKYMAMKYFQGVIDEYSLCFLKGYKDWSVVV